MPTLGKDRFVSGIFKRELKIDFYARLQLIIRIISAMFLHPVT